MKKTYYEKKGRRYVSTSEYDSDLLSSYQAGAHLVMSVPGGSVTKYNIKPEYAPMIAAAQVAREKISATLIKAFELRPTKPLLTAQQLQAWQNFVNTLGDSSCMVEYDSIFNIVDSAIDVMVEEQERLLTNPAVKAAYEQFLFISALTHDSDDARK